MFRRRSSARSVSVRKAIAVGCARCGLGRGPTGICMCGLAVRPVVQTANPRRHRWSAASATQRDRALARYAAARLHAAHASAARRSSQSDPGCAGVFCCAKPDTVSARARRRTRGIVVRGLCPLRPPGALPPLDLALWLSRARCFWLNEGDLSGITAFLDPGLCVPIVPPRYAKRPWTGG